MSNHTGPGVLARLFRKKSATSFTAELHARAINKPLFVQSDMGAQLINAYLHGPQQPLQAVDGTRTGELTVRTDDGIAVMDISGALTSRRIEMLCDSAPASYEQMREELAMHYQSANTIAIVLRLDTPGGEAAQNIDMADFIAQNRGKKPVIAMVDDMAYSAGYAIAAACDEIWITRTGGVGSVGVVTYHIDQSDFNGKVGIKVEFIHAGQRKVDFNPHNPLSDDARDRMQSEVDRLYEMFATSVAENRGLSVEAVKATEAGTYHGERAIEVGFADHLGTFADLLSYLGSEDYDAQAVMSGSRRNTPQALQELPTENAEETGLSEDDEPPVVDAVDSDLEIQANDGVPGDGQELDESEPVAEDEQTAEQISSQKEAEIKAVCMAAGLPEVAQDYIAAGVAVEQVRADLIDLRQVGDVEIESTQKVSVAEPSASGVKHVTASSVYARRNKRGK